ncbi:MAG: tRNA (adenosine(37)-N6)-threonylcarbamoyltransferase complex ATPase subunit type 1 TsaE [Candidatus Omnitrophota bacterium]
MKKIITNSAKETVFLGKRISRLLQGQEIIGLFGELGSGKTTLAKGLAEGLGVKRAQVNSPSFILMRKYTGKLPLYHFDLYRIKDAQEICNIGYEEFVFADGVSVIEWAEKMGALLPKDYLKIELVHIGGQKRLIKLLAKGRRHRELLSRL